MTALAERVETALARALAAAPAPLVRVLAGRQIVREGQRLDPQVQLALRLENLQGGFKPAPVEGVRERRGATRAPSPARRSRSPRCATSRSRARPGRSAPGCTGPEGLAARRRWSSTTTAAGTSSAISTRTTSRAASSRTSRPPSSSRSTTASGPSTASRPPSTTRSPRSSGRSRMPPSLGADPDRIAVAGDSAGGNLATVVAQLAAAAGGPAPAFQVLIYPVSDYSRKRPSYETFADGFFLTREEMDWFRDNYFACADQRSDPRASPILAADLAGIAARARRHRGLRSAARRGRGLRRGAARGRRGGHAQARARSGPRIHQRGRASAAARARR